MSHDVVFYHAANDPDLVDANQQPLPEGWYYRFHETVVGPFHFPTQANLDYQETIRD